MLLLFFLFGLNTALASGLTDLSGKPVDLSNYRGKWVLINFWATWCPPCIEEIPVLEKLYEEKKLVVIGIAVSYQRPSEVTDFVKKNPIPYPVVMGDEGAVEAFGDIDTLPTSLIYSPDGRLAGRYQGPLSEKELLSFIQG